MALSCLVLYTPLAGRMLRAGGRDGPTPPPQYMPRRALASPRVGARITRVRFSTKSNYLSHIRSSHIRLQSSVDHCQTGAASESLSTAVASLPGSYFLSHLTLPLTYTHPLTHSLTPPPTHSLPHSLTPSPPHPTHSLTPSLPPSHGTPHSATLTRRSRFPFSPRCRHAAGGAPRVLALFLPVGAKRAICVQALTATPRGRALQPSDTTGSRPSGESFFPSQCCRLGTGLCVPKGS